MISPEKLKGYAGAAVVAMPLITALLKEYNSYNKEKTLRRNNYYNSINEIKKLELQQSRDKEKAEELKTMTALKNENDLKKLERDQLRAKEKAEELANQLLIRSKNDLERRKIKLELKKAINEYKLAKYREKLQYKLNKQKFKQFSDVWIDIFLEGYFNGF